MTALHVNLFPLFQLRSGVNFTQNIAGYKDGLLTSTLRIKKLSEGDLQPGAEYVCEASNDLGKDSRRFAVRPPRTQRNLDDPTRSPAAAQASGAAPTPKLRISLVALLSAMLLLMSMC